MSETEYWNKVYGSTVITTKASSFAKSILSLLPKNQPILEFGCGNGRDALFFHAQGCANYTGCDISSTSIEQLSRQHKDKAGLRFMVADFSQLSIKGTFACVYSRFTLHSVCKRDASKALAWAYEHLDPNGGLLLIEARTVDDPMCGKGTKVEGEADAYVHTHYRRFLRPDALATELKELGFVIEHIETGSGWSVHGDDDPVLVRIHARRKK